MWVQVLEEVGAALRDLGISHAIAAPSDEGLLQPDMALTSIPGRVALLIDGASKFSINPPHQPLGNAILNCRLLMLRGWKVRSPSSRSCQLLR